MSILNSINRCVCVRVCVCVNAFYTLVSVLLLFKKRSRKFYLLGSFNLASNKIIFLELYTQPILYNFYTL